MNFSKRATESASMEIGNVLSTVLDAAIAAKRDADYAATRGSGVGDVAAKRIGAGYIGTPCERCLAFRYHKFPKEERESSVTPGELQRHAEAGHWTEHVTADWLALIGFNIATYQMNDHGNPVLDAFGKEKQIGWMAARDPETGQYRMAGEVDGMIIGFAETPYVAPADLNRIIALIRTPCIWESKKATDKKAKKFAKDGVAGADPIYYGQLQINMGYLGVSQTLFSMLNLDTMRYHFELVPYDAAKAQALSDRAAGVIRSASPYDLPRLCRAEDDFNGKFCDYHDQCWRPSHPIKEAPRSGFNPNEMDEVPF